MDFTEYVEGAIKNAVKNTEMMATKIMNEIKSRSKDPKSAYPLGLFEPIKEMTERISQEISSKISAEVAREVAKEVAKEVTKEYLKEYLKDVLPVVIKEMIEESVQENIRKADVALKNFTSKFSMFKENDDENSDKNS